MGCSSPRQPSGPSALQPDLDSSGGGDSSTLPHDPENQNQGLNGYEEEGGATEEGEGGEGEEGGGGGNERDQARLAEAHPTLERLAQATGGTEKSWYRCVFPFGVISLVIGMAGTGVSFTFNTLPQTKVVSVALLCVGLVLLLVAAVCWRSHRARKRKKKEGVFFCSEQGML